MSSNNNNSIYGGRDTICAISTPPGVGGIAVARVSGPDAIAIVDTLWKGKSLKDVASHTAHLGTIVDSRREPLDQCVATVYRSPRSFTGEDVVEISVHGSRWIQRELINALCNAGCRVAEPGEFTRRAFTSGRIDLMEAEGIADMIASTSRAAHRAASAQMRGHYSQHISSLREQLIELASLMELELDFSEEEVEFASRRQLSEIATELHQSLTKLRDSFATGSVIKEGIPVAIIGPTNAGKSSLLNALTGDDRAIVSDIHGTTRDIVDDTIEIGDYLFRLQDTAGLRDTADEIERIGIQRSMKAASTASIVIFIIDTNDPDRAIELLNESNLHERQDDLIILLNKTDIASESVKTEITEKIAVTHPQATLLPISTRNATDIDNLKRLLTKRINQETTSGDLLITNARHAQALGQAAQSITRVLEGLQTGISGDFIAQDIRETIHHLSALTGTITTTDLLSTIFSKFCIGK